MPSVYDTLEDIVKDTIANDIAKIQSETLDALGGKHKEIKMKERRTSYIIQQYNITEYTLP